MNAPLRRGSCPGLSAPMQTGDGLLVRMLPLGTISLDRVAALCAGAREHGNGVIEVTARGSIQVRGLNSASAPRFAAAIAALGIAAADGIAVHTSPLSGLDPDELLDVGKLAGDLRRAVAERGLTGRLAPKISIVTDGGGALGLDGLAADVRLRAELENGRVIFDVSIGGDRGSATPLGFVAPENVAATVICILEVIARRGRNVRARAVIMAEGTCQFRSVIGDLLLDLELASRLRGNKRTAIGAHRLRDGSLACGAGLAFGHADASSLENLIEAAAARGATGLRAAPDRALIFIGFSPEALSVFSADAERLGFVVRVDDPRRFVVACAGAPVCGSAHIAARTLAPCIATECAESLGEQFNIHVSGCAKGCAYSRPAALTVVGAADGCALIANGAVNDAPFATVQADELAAVIGRFAEEVTSEAHHV